MIKLKKRNVREKKSWAVIGVTPKKKINLVIKYGKKLKEHDYEVYGINPNYHEIEGEKIYSNIKDITDKIDVVDMVIPPKLSMVALDEIKELGIQYIFFQPGTYNDEVVKRASDLGFKYLIDDCIYATLKALE